MGVIDTDRFSSAMRARIVDVGARRLLVTDFHGSTQEADLSVPANCGGVGRIRHFRRATAPGWPENALPIDPACRALGLPHADVLRTQLFQNAACNWRCWYCFVPYDRLSGDPEKSSWLTADDLVERYLAEPDGPAVIVISGGQPDLVPEWTLWMMDALERRGLARSVYLWSDDNLSTDYLFRFLEDAELARIAAYPMYGRVGCFKGFDGASFAFNTGAAPELFDRQFDLMGRLLAAGLDAFAYVTLTTPSAAGIPERVARFVDRLQTVSERLPLRTVPLRVERFTPVQDRMTSATLDALSHQECAIEAWQEEIAARFTTAELALAMPDVRLGPKHGSVTEERRHA